MGSRCDLLGGDRHTVEYSTVSVVVNGATPLVPWGSSGAQLAVAAGDTDTQVEQGRTPSHSTGALRGSMAVEASTAWRVRPVVESAGAAGPGTVQSQRQGATGKVGKGEHESK